MNAESCQPLVPVASNRKSLRRTVLWRATLQVGDINHPVWVRNIGAGGAAVQGEAIIPVSTAVVLDIAVHGPFRGYIIWSTGTLHGLAFHDSAESVIERFAENAEILGMVADAL